MTKNVFVVGGWREKRGIAVKMAKNELIMDRWLKKIKALLIQYKFPFWGGIVAGILTHMFMFTNKLPNHDDVYHTFGKGSSVTSGRWGLELLSFVFPDYSMPWIYGILSILILSVSACVIVTLLDIKAPSFQTLTSALILSFPSLVGTFTYMFTSAPYALAFLIACGSTLILVRKKSAVGFAIAVLGMLLSLSIYQSYISVASTLLLLVLLKGVLRKERFIFLDFIREGIKYLLFLVLALGLYYASIQLSFAITGQTYNVYAYDNINSDVAAPLERLWKSIWILIPELFGGEYGLLIPVYSRIATVAGIILSVAIAGVSMLRKKELLRVVAGGLIGMLFPISINCMFLFTAFYAVHTLVLYSFVLLYVLMIVIAESDDTAVGLCVKNILSFALAVVLIGNIFIGNEAYLKMHIAYENTYAFYSALVSRVEQSSEFDEECQIALIGRTSSYLYFRKNFLNFPVTGVTEWSFNGGMHPNIYSKELFIQRYIGFNVPFADDNTKAEIAQTSEFAEMPVYPYHGSIKRIGDNLVVKFSDVG